MTDILRKRLALFHPLNLDNSLYVGIDERSSHDGYIPILNSIYCQGCELFFYIHIQAVQSQTESIVLFGSHFSFMPNLKRQGFTSESHKDGREECLYGVIRHFKLFY